MEGYRRFSKDPGDGDDPGAMRASRTCRSRQFACAPGAASTRHGRAGIHCASAAGKTGMPNLAAETAGAARRRIDRDFEQRTTAASGMRSDGATRFASGCGRSHGSARGDPSTRSSSRTNPATRTAIRSSTRWAGRTTSSADRKKPWPPWSA